MKNTTTQRWILAAIIAVGLPTVASAGMACGPGERSPNFERKLAPLELNAEDQAEVIAILESLHQSRIALSNEHKQALMEIDAQGEEQLSLILNPEQLEQITTMGPRRGGMKAEMRGRPPHAGKGKDRC